MPKPTSLSSALAALVITSALSGCGGGSAEPVSGPIRTGSHAQATTGEAAKAAAADKVKAAGVAEAAKKADAAAAKAATVAKATADQAKAAAVAEAARSEDAAAAYWRIITKFNVANAAYMNACGCERVNQAPRPPAVPENFRAAARAYSAAYTQEVAELRAYGAWPQSVKPLIDQFIAQKAILADRYLQQSAVTGWDAWNREAVQANAGRVQATRLSALIRQALGLPPQEVGQGAGSVAPA